MEQETVVVGTVSAAELDEQVNGTKYPSLVSGTMHEFVTFYNANSGLDPIKKFKNKATAIQAVQQIIATLEGVPAEGQEEEAEEIHADATSLSAQLTAANSGEKKTSEKNEGVWLNVKMLLAQGKTNKEILAELKEMYGNSNTTYACVAWYRNKWKKMVPVVSAEDKVGAWMLKHNLSGEVLSTEAIADLVGMLK